MASHVVVGTTDSVEFGPLRSRGPRILQRVLVLGLCALLILAVLWFGAVEERSTFAFEAGAAALFLLWTVNQLVSEQLKLSKNPLYPPTFLFFGLVLSQIVLRRSACNLFYFVRLRVLSSRDCRHRRRGGIPLCGTSIAGLSPICMFPGAFPP